MDCFYAAIEMRDFPELASIPLAVGGAPDKRGVITTCNYIAREFGIHSAMASAHALRLCPQLKIQAVRMEVYREESAYIRAIFADYTDKIEPLSLDEAYLDVTGSHHQQGSATWIAQEIRQRIYDTRQLTASAGVGPNKSLAKIASDWHKPNGLMVITPDTVSAFMENLSTRKLFGVGPVTEQKLAQLGVKTCGELQRLSEESLTLHFGSMGKRLFELSRGIDHREVKTDHIRKSISVEETYLTDLLNVSACMEEIPALLNRLSIRMDRAGEVRPIHNVFVKLKFNDFQQTTVERLANKIELPLIDDLLTEGWHRKALPVRLLGIGVRFREENSRNILQLSLPGMNDL